MKKKPKPKLSKGEFPKSADIRKGPPINVAVPNVSQLKLESILALSVAIQKLAYALASSNVNVSVCNNMVSHVDTGINVSMLNDLDPNDY